VRRSAARTARWSRPERGPALDQSSSFFLDSGFFVSDVLGVLG